MSNANVFDASQYYNPNELVGGSEYVAPDLRISEQAGVGQGQVDVGEGLNTNLPPDTLKYRERSSGAFWAGIVLILLVIAAVLIYIFFGEKYSEEQVRSELEDGDDIDAKLGSLTVVNNTVLGNSSSDRLAVNAGLLSDITPTTDSSLSLGSASKKWDVTYTDAVVFENGVSMIRDDDGIQLTGSLGYQRKVKELELDTLSYNVPVSESGYLFVINEPSSQSAASQLNLPAATGSGVFYDFVAGTSIGPFGSEDFAIVTSGSDLMRGNMKLVSENTGPGSSLLATIMTTSSTTDSIVVDADYPIDYDNTGYQGIRTGSNWRLVDYGLSVWSVSGTMILQSGPSIGLFSSPFR